MINTIGHLSNLKLLREQLTAQSLSRPDKLKTTNPAPNKMAGNSPHRCCHGYSRSTYRRDCCHGQEPPNHCHRKCCPGHCRRKRNWRMNLNCCDCTTCLRMRQEELARELERIRYFREKWEDRERRERHPNYVPTVDDRFYDAIGAAITGGVVALVTYGIFQMMGID